MSAKIPAELTALFSRYIEERMGLYFPPDRAETLDSAMDRVSEELGYEDPASCIRGLLLAPATKAQLDVLASHLTVGETYFFRDKQSFNILKERILPELIQARRQTGRILRIWSAGCATGEEPYSIAILLHSMLTDFKDWNIRITGTDVNPAFLKKAEKGVYGEWSFRDTPAWVRNKFFKKASKGLFELLPEIRRHVDFFYHNLAEDAYPSITNETNGIDVIFCRNVIMYFAEANRKKTIGKLSNCLVDGGWLIVSPVESFIAQYSPCLKTPFSEPAIYKKDLLACDRPNIVAGSKPGKSKTFLPERTVIQPPAAPLAISAPAAAEANEILFAQALELYEAGSYAEAETRIAPLSVGDNGPALALAARINANQGRLSAALEFCEKAIIAEKLNPAYHYLLSSIQLEMGREDESKLSLGRALYLDQDFALAHFAFGNLARRKGMKKEALRHFETALSALRKKYSTGDIVPESGGITAGRMIEIIGRTIQEEVAA